MTTRWDGVQLNGSKDFVTTGDAVQWLLVSARRRVPTSRRASACSPSSRPLLA